MKLSGMNWKDIGGAQIHVVVNEDDKTVGWIREVFPDVFYTQLADPQAQLAKKSVRYRSAEDALGEFNG